MAISRILVANRGEIAVRIIRAARELGIHTVQAVSAADRDMLAARLADSVIDVGPAHATKSYLNKDAILAAAAASGAGAIHPGYGFLSENADFAAKVEAAGLEVEVRFIAEGKDTTRVELEHRKLDRYGARRDEMRAIFDSEGDWGRVLQMFAAHAAQGSGP